MMLWEWYMNVLALLLAGFFVVVLLTMLLTAESKRRDSPSRLVCLWRH